MEEEGDSVLIAELTLDACSKKIDCIKIHIPSIGSALEFYETKLGLELVWRKGNSGATLKTQSSGTEPVLASEKSSAIRSEH
jgi:hypothetical protein